MTWQRTVVCIETDKSWKHRALRRTRLVNGYSKWVLKLNSPLFIINTPSFLLFLGYFHEPQWNQQATVWFSFTYWWTPFGIIMYFLMHSLAVIALTPLKFPLSSCMMCLSTPCYSTLAESIMGSSACRLITQTCICGKEGWWNSDFFTLCSLLLFSSESHHILPS